MRNHCAGSPAYAANAINAKLPACTTGVAPRANPANANTTATSGGRRRNGGNVIHSGQCISWGDAATHGTCSKCGTIITATSRMRRGSAHTSGSGGGGGCCCCSGCSGGGGTAAGRCRRVGFISSSCNINGDHRIAPACGFERQQNHL